MSVFLFIFFIVSFPEAPRSLLPFVAGVLLILAAFGAGAGLRFMGLSLVMTLALELAFLTGVCLILGYLLPQTSGTPPIVQWAQGYRPRRSDAQEGVRRLGLNSETGAGRLVVNLYPKD